MNLNHFGIFLNLNNKSSSNIIQEKSDLIGNGFLTNYVFLFKFEISKFNIFYR